MIHTNRFDKKSKVSTFLTGEHLTAWLVAQMNVPEPVAKRIYINPRTGTVNNPQLLSEVFSNPKYNQYNSFLLNGRVYVDMGITSGENTEQMIRKLAETFPTNSHSALSAIPLRHEILFTSALAIAVVIELVM